MKLLQLIALALVLFMIGGCWGQVDIERVGPVLQLSLETASNGQLLFTNSYPVFDTNNTKQDDLVSIQVETPRESRAVWDRISPQVIQGGKIQQYIFAEEFARRGLFPWLEVLQRDPINPPLVSIAIVDGSPKEMMEKAAHFKDKPRTPIYIKQLLESNRDRYAAVNDVFRFYIAYFAPGIDPFAPIIKLEPKDIRLTGTALFAGDRMVGSIDIDQTIMLLALMGRLRESEYIFRYPARLPGINSSKPSASVRISVTKRKMKIRLINGKPEVEFNLKFSGILDEYSWNKMDHPESQHKLEQSFAKELTGCCNQLILKLQQVGSDPIGIGDQIRAKYNQYWKQNKPEQIYQTTRIKVKIKMRIMNYGAIK